MSENLKKREKPLNGSYCENGMEEIRKEEKISCLEYVGMIFFEAIPCVSTCMVLVLYLLQTAYLSHAARAKVKGRV